MEKNQIAAKHASVKLDDVLISYDEMGTGNIPIIFVHGFPFSKAMWKPQMQNLDTISRVIAYDIRGYGESQEGTQKASIRLFADDLIRFMDALEIDKAVVCGSSMGGYIVLNAVNRYPKRFKAVILCDTQCIADSTEAKEGRKKTIAQVEAGGLADFAESFLGKAFSKKTLETNKELVGAIREIILSTSPETITNTLIALAERDEMCTKLNMISVPALILCGDDDIITPVEQSRKLQTNMPGATLQVIRDAGHLSNLEQPDKFNNHISQFFNDLSG